MIDDKALKRYRKTEGSFGNRLHNSIDWKEGSFLRYEGRCAFLNEEISAIFILNRERTACAGPAGSIPAIQRNLRAAERFLCVFPVRWLQN